MATTSLTDLPQELLGRVLSFLLPSDIVRFGKTCRQAYSFINPGNQLLWQDAFLHVYDDPEPMRNNTYIELSGKAAQWDWYHQVKSRSEAIKCLKRRWPIEGEFENQQSHLDAILSIIDTAAPRPSAHDLRKGAMPRVDDRSSRNIQLLTSIIAEDDAGFERITFEVGKSLTHSIKGPTTRSMSQSFQDQNRADAARRLHTLTGLSHRDKTERRNFYRRYVYDWALTSDANDHGPFLKDGSGRVDWTLLEGAMVCISHSFQITVDGSLAAPEGLWYSIPHRTLQDPTLIEDWAGVTGRWLGTYAFLDYSSLLAWNTGLMDPRHGYSTTLDLRDEPEAVGDLLLMDLKLDDSCRTDPILRSNVPISDKLPPLYFKGTSRGSEYPNHPTTVIKGFAALMVGGREVKWKFIVEYHGVDQWQLEGVQPGGVRSGGIFGLWSNAEHEPNGPVGPFCYYPQQLCKPTSVVLAGGQD